MKSEGADYTLSPLITFAKMRKELSLGKTKQYYRNFHFCGVASSTILPAINSVKIISVGTDESTALS